MSYLNAHQPMFRKAFVLTHKEYVLKGSNQAIVFVRAGAQTLLIFN